MKPRDKTPHPAMCWKPEEMSRAEFDSLLREVVWETKDDEVSRLAERVTCRGLGELYSLELLMRIGVWLKIQGVPMTEDEKWWLRKTESSK